MSASECTFAAGTGVLANLDPSVALTLKKLAKDPIGPSEEELASMVQGHTGAPCTKHQIHFWKTQNNIRRGRARRTSTPLTDDVRAYSTRARRGTQRPPPSCSPSLFPARPSHPSVFASTHRKSCPLLSVMHIYRSLHFSFSRPLLTFPLLRLPTIPPPSSHHTATPAATRPLCDEGTQPHLRICGVPACPRSSSDPLSHHCGQGTCAAFSA